MSPSPLRHQIDVAVRQILVDDFELELEDLRAEARLRDDLELDSLDAVDLIVAIERTFSIRLEENAARQMATVGAICDHLEQLRAAPSAPAAPGRG